MTSLDDLVRAWRERAAEAERTAEEQAERVARTPPGQILLSDLSVITAQRAVSQTYLQAAQELEAALKGKDG